MAWGGGRLGGRGLINSLLVNLSWFSGIRLINYVLQFTKHREKISSNYFKADIFLAAKLNGSIRLFLYLNHLEEMWFFQFLYKIKHFTSLELPFFLPIRFISQCSFLFPLFSPHVIVRLGKGKRLPHRIRKLALQG